MSQSYRKSLLSLAALSNAAFLFGAVALGGLSCAQDPPKAPPPRYATLPPKTQPEFPAFLKGTILERMDHTNPEPTQVSAFGLVVNLPGTGDGAAPTQVREYIIKEMQRRGFGSVRNEALAGLSPERVLDDPRRRTAIVRVDGFLPPGVRKGQAFDVVVTALEDSGVTSLSGGTLWQTELKRGGANTVNPGGTIAVEALAEGPIFLNPSLALNPRSAATSRNISRLSRRQGLILDGGVAKTDQTLILRLRAPQRSVIRQIEARIDQFFLDPTVASAKDEAMLHLTVPESYRGDWQRFLGVCTHLYIDGTPETLLARSKILAQEALKPDAPLLDISFAWEGMGEVALPAIQPLMAPNQPQDVQFAAARAAAFIGDPTAQQALLRIASTENHQFQIDAVRTLGALRNTPGVNSLLRRLLNSDSSLVRIEAYKVLAANNSADVQSNFLPRLGVDERFILDIVPSSKPPIVYASRSGLPRIALIGEPAMLQTPVTFTALDDRLSITSRPDLDGVTIFYRQEGAVRPARIQSRTGLAELIGWLGGAGREPDTRVDLTYGEIVAILQGLADQRLLVPAERRSDLVSARGGVQFVLQETAGVEDQINDAPPIVPRTRSQSGENAPDLPTTRRAPKPDEKPKRDRQKSPNSQANDSAASVR